MTKLNIEALEKFCGGCDTCAGMGELPHPALCPYMTEAEKQSFYTEAK